MPLHHHARRFAAASPKALPRFTIGSNSAGRWVVNDREGRVGGIFVSRDAALHFAVEECDHDLSQISFALGETTLRLITGGEDPIVH